MRVCVKHMGKAVMTLTDKLDGSEYDLCQACKDEFMKLFVVEPTKEEPEVKRGRKRNA